MAWSSHGNGGMVDSLRTAVRVIWLMCGFCFALAALFLTGLFSWRLVEWLISEVLANPW